MIYRTPADVPETTADIMVRVRERFTGVERELRAMNAPRVRTPMWSLDVRYYPDNFGWLCIRYSHWSEHTDIDLCNTVHLLPGLLAKARKACAKRDAAARKARAHLDVVAAKARDAL